MSEVFILWDIDGTINVTGRANRWDGEWLTSLVTRSEAPALFENLPERIQELPLRVNQTLLDSISLLDSHPSVVNAWLTAWEQEANNVFCPRIGFQSGEKWKSFIAPEGSFTLDPVEAAIWWKTIAVREFLIQNPEAKVIWVDDLIDTTHQVEMDNRALEEDFDGRVALVGVVPHIGVTPDSFNFIKRLATEKWQSGVFIFDN